MSRRSRQWRSKLGYPTPSGRKPGQHQMHPSQCGGDKDKLRATKPGNMIKPIRFGVEPGKRNPRGASRSAVEEMGG